MTTKPLAEKEIDEFVIAQADDDSAWEAPIWVKSKDLPATIELPKILAAKAAFFARLHLAFPLFRKILPGIQTFQEA